MFITDLAKIKMQFAILAFDCKDHARYPDADLLVGLLQIFLLTKIQSNKLQFYIMPFTHFDGTN